MTQVQHLNHTTGADCSAVILVLLTDTMPIRARFGGAGAVFLAAKIAAFTCFHWLATNG